MLKGFALDSFFGFGHAPRPTSAVRQQHAAGSALWLKLTAAALIVVSAALFGSYVISANSYSTTGDAIQHLQIQLSGLNDQNQKLTVKVAQETSMAQLHSEVLGADFVPAGTPQFLQVNQLSER